MPRRRSRSRARPIEDSSLTPLVDVTFLLIVFFVVVAHLSSNERIPMPLSRVESAETAPDKLQRRVVINVIPAERRSSMGGDYLVGVRTFGSGDADLARLRDLLATRRASQPDAAAVIRAARTEPYERIHPVLEACRLAGMTDVRLVTEETNG
ncbi:MAG: biopolymer transporter ExbD [Phycisphaeraceae bacterium]|nr:biopolymer transporter ExbD [Phycisphaeraceae bacterium]